MAACSLRCPLLNHDVTTQVDHESAAPGQEAGTHFEPADCWSDLYDAFEQAEILIYIVGGWLIALSACCTLNCGASCVLLVHPACVGAQCIHIIAAKLRRGLAPSLPTGMLYCGCPSHLCALQQAELPCIDTVWSRRLCSKRKLQ